MDKISKEMLEVATKIDSLFDTFFSIKNFPSAKLAESMRYSTIGGGKKFRPYLLYKVSQNLGVAENIALYVGACIEMLHSYTLIHDDLPCMDNDDIRRGKPSNHKKFNEYTAVLAGDSLQSEAFYLLSSNKLDLEAQIKLDIINLVAETIGPKNLISGQMLDLEFERNNLSEDDSININQIHNLKTAKLIVLCLLIPAVIARKDDEYKQKLVEYGETLGLIYQMVDDLNDYEDESDESMNMIDAIGIEKTKIQLEETNKKSLELLKELEIEELSKLNEFITRI